MAVPEWHAAEHRRVFGYVERPLRSMFPDAQDAAVMVLGRSLFSAVHGVVSLGLEEKLVWKVARSTNTTSRTNPHITFQRVLED